MPVIVKIPGAADLAIHEVLLDVNGTLTNRGNLLGGVSTRIKLLRQRVGIHLVSADTFGTLEPIAALLGVRAVRAGSGQDKLRELEQLGPHRCAVIGNGANDVLVLEAASLGIVVLGPEGSSSAALRAADVVCISVVDALDLVLDPLALSATLRP